MNTLKNISNNQTIIDFLKSKKDIFTKPNGTLTYDDLCKVADYLLACSAVFSSQNDCGELYDYLIHENKKKERGETFTILEGSDALIAYTLTNWYFRDTLELNIENLEKLSECIRKDFTPAAQGKRINTAQINNMLALVNEKYDINQILRDEPINILFFDCAYTHGNSMYGVSKHKDLKDMIIMTCICDDVTQPEYTFLHELGHLLHTRISHKIFDPPKSFDSLIPLIQQLNPSVPPKPSRRWLSEVFADFFAMAVLLGSPCADYDIYPEVTREQKIEMETFFDVLLSTLPYNKKGNHSWDFLSKKYGQLDWWGEDPYDDLS